MGYDTYDKSLLQYAACERALQLKSTIKKVERIAQNLNKNLFKRH